MARSDDGDECLSLRALAGPPGSASYLGSEHADDLVRLFQDPVVAAWYGGTWSMAEAEAFAR